MTERHTIAMQMRSRGERADHAREELANALPGAEIGTPDDTGTFEIAVEAPTFSDALDTVFDGVAAAGADDHVVLMEHPGIPEHYRHRADRPRT